VNIGTHRTLQMDKWAKRDTGNLRPPAHRHAVTFKKTCSMTLAQQLGTS